MNESRAAICERTYEAARSLAESNGLALTNPSDACYQLRQAEGWIINVYPRRNGVSGRIYHDSARPGPFLYLPQDWTLLDVVKAAIAAEARKNRKRA